MSDDAFVLAGTVLGGAEPGTRAGWIEVRDGRVVDAGEGRPPRAPVDLGTGALLAPGFVDLQVNGVGGHDFATADVDGWLAALRRLAGAGTTACLPTLVTAPLDAYDELLGRARTARDRAVRGPEPRAQVLGVHLEGPFLGGAPGAHPREQIRPVDLDWLRALVDRHGDLVRLVTLAPEADPGLAATRFLHARGVVVALGHSTASYEDAVQAAAAGARLVTHVFNGMGPLHHRAPGLAGAALTLPDLVPTLIADLVHVHPAVVRLVTSARPDAVLVSDAVAVEAGTAGSVRLERGAGAVRLADGTLAGSTIGSADAVRNLTALGVPVERAVAMASTHPARVLGDPERGRLAPGARADVVALDPDTAEVVGVWVAGQRVSRR